MSRVSHRSRQAVRFFGTIKCYRCGGIQWIAMISGYWMSGGYFPMSHPICGLQQCSPMISHDPCPMCFLESQRTHHRALPWDHPAPWRMRRCEVPSEPEVMRSWGHMVLFWSWLVDAGCESTYFQYLDADNQLIVWLFWSEMSLAEFVTFSDPKWTNPSYNYLSKYWKCVCLVQSLLLISASLHQRPRTTAPQTRFGTPYMDGTPLSNCAIPPGRNHARRTLPLDQDIWSILISVWVMFWEIGRGHPWPGSGSCRSCLPGYRLLWKWSFERLNHPKSHQTLIGIIHKGVSLEYDHMLLDTVAAKSMPHVWLWSCRWFLQLRVLRASCGHHLLSLARVYATRGWS